MKIDKFRGFHAFMSNFYSSPIRWEGRIWSTVEHAYQAAKNMKYADMILECEDPGEAKQIGKRLSPRKDWEDVKVEIMYELVYAKFAQNLNLANKLISTEEQIEEGNTWHDNFWGVCKCGDCQDGKNMLGRILMDVRDALREERNGKN